MDYVMVLRLHNTLGPIKIHRHVGCYYATVGAKVSLPRTGQHDHPPEN